MEEVYHLLLPLLPLGTPPVPALPMHLPAVLGNLLHSHLAITQLELFPGVLLQIGAVLMPQGELCVPSKLLFSSHLGPVNVREVCEGVLSELEKVQGHKNAD